MSRLLHDIATGVAKPVIALFGATTTAPGRLVGEPALVVVEIDRQTAMGLEVAKRVFTTAAMPAVQGMKIAALEVELEARIGWLHTDVEDLDCGPFEKALPQGRECFRVAGAAGIDLHVSGFSDENANDVWSTVDELEGVLRGTLVGPGVFAGAKALEVLGAAGGQMDDVARSVLDAADIRLSEPPEVHTDPRYADAPDVELTWTAQGLGPGGRSCYDLEISCDFALPLGEVMRLCDDELPKDDSSDIDVLVESDPSVAAESIRHNGPYKIAITNRDAIEAWLEEHAPAAVGASATPGM